MDATAIAVPARALVYLLMRPSEPGRFVRVHVKSMEILFDSHE
jgi:hypothetical protein